MATKSTAKKSPAKAKKAPAKKAPAKAAPKKAAAKPAPAAKPAKAPKAPKANGTPTYAQLAETRFTESKVENPVRAMWDLCDNNVNMRRKDVIALAVEQGISYYTARTQYQLWLTAYRNSK